MNKYKKNILKEMYCSIVWMSKVKILLKLDDSYGSILKGHTH